MIAPARWAAFAALRAVTERRLDLPAALAWARRGLQDERDRALASEIVTGVLRWRAALDHLVAYYAHRPLDRLDAVVLDALRTGAYQLLHLERVPPRAAVDDGVEIVKRAGRRSAAGLVNAVLRAIARERSRVPLPPPPDLSQPDWRTAALDYLSITLSHPRWLASRWLDRHGFEASAAWARFNNAPAPLTLRVNTLRTTTSILILKLRAAGIDVEPARYAPDALVVRRGNPLLSSLAETGRFVVQDEASQLVALFAAARPGDRVLDACASPGNKTLALAGTMRDEGLLVATDVRERRIGLLRRTLAPAALRSVRIVRADLTRPAPFRDCFDLVLLDAPCSGLGTIRRDPDIRWRRTESDLPRLARTQLEFLERTADTVRPGGRLVYATCSSEPEENDEVVTRFLEGHAEFRLVDPRAVLPPADASLAAVLDDGGCLRTLPWPHGLEAFFAAMLVKSKHL